MEILEPMEISPTGKTGDRHFIHRYSGHRRLLCLLWQTGDGASAHRHQPREVDFVVGTEPETSQDVLFSSAYPVAQ